MTRIRDFCSPLLENSLKSLDRHLPNDNPLRELALLHREAGKSLSSSDVTPDKPSYAKNSLISRHLSSSSPTSSMRTRCNGAGDDTEGRHSDDEGRSLAANHDGVDDGSRLHFPALTTSGGGDVGNSCNGEGEAKKERENRKRKRRNSACSVSRKRRNDISSSSNYGSSKRAKKEESPSKTSKDGHLILTPGMTIGNYDISDFLGEGAFGRVALCTKKDEGLDERIKKQLAVKIVRKSKKYYDSAKLEVNVLETLKKKDPSNKHHFVKIEDSFTYKGHACLVFEKLGANLYDFMKANHNVPYPRDQVFTISSQIISAVDFMHRNKIIHTDLKPENILFVNCDSFEQYHKSSGRTIRVMRSPNIRIIDFGSATFEHDHHSRIVSTRHYRAPEVILELGWSYPCDVWSIGCIIFELFTGVTLFMTHDNVEHLVMIERVLEQSISSRMVRRTQKRKYFYHGRLDFDERSKEGRYVRHNVHPLASYFRSSSRTERHLLDLIRRLLACHPSDRITLQKAMRHAYFSS